MYNRLFRLPYILIFEKCLGWKIIGSKPEYKKFVTIVAPHTSNWDFMVGEWARSRLRWKGWYIAKKELFRWPFGWLFRLLGGFPVDRSKGSNLVGQIVDLFNSRDTFNITIAPEGTRKFNEKWRTGFYAIALQAKVPIQMVAFDYEKRLVTIATPFFPSGDMEKDLVLIKGFFKPHKGKNPKEGIL